MSGTREQAFGSGPLDPDGDVCYRFIPDAKKIVNNHECQQFDTQEMIFWMIMEPTERIISHAFPLTSLEWYSVGTLPY